MELEDMKTTWEKLSQRVEEQEILTSRMIEKMTQQKYISSLNKIGYAEFTGTIICYIGAAYLSVNLTKIEEPFMQFFGVVSIVLLLLVPIVSLQSLRAIKSESITLKPHIEAIKMFAMQKVKFQKLQKLNVALGLLLMLISMPVLSAMQGKDLSQTPYFWTLIFPIFVLFFLAFAFWALRYYNKALKEAERMLTEINS